MRLFNNLTPLPPLQRRGGAQPDFKNIEGVNYNLDLLGRLASIWKKESPYYSFEWVRWRTKLLNGELGKINPVAENEKIFRNRKRQKHA